MSRVRIDFAPVARWWPGPRTALLLVVLALVAAGLGRAALEGQAELARLTAQQAGRMPPAGPVPAPAPAYAPPAPEAVAAVNEAITLLNLPWPALLDGLDAARPPGVALLRLEPRAAQRTLRVVAESEQADALFDFARALGQQPPFVSVSPVSQARIEGTPRVQASFDLVWQR